jgi:hypothetical protein
MHAARDIVDHMASAEMSLGEQLQRGLASEGF